MSASRPGASGQSPAQRVVGVVCGSLCCASYAVRPDLAVLAPSALAWVLSGRTLAARLRRLAGVALLLGLVATPFGIALTRNLNEATGT